MDPIAVDDPEVKRLHDLVLEVAKEVDTRLRIHDFRIVPGDTHTNLIFDVEAPFEVELADDGLRERLFEGVQARDKCLYTVVTVDRG